MISREEAKTRVARGAAHLDTVKPGWFNWIDVGTLTLHDPCGCIVGQLCGLQSLGDFAYGDPFNSGVRRLFGSDAHGTHCGVVLGLDEDGMDDDAYDSLQDAWIEAIADRRLSSAQPQRVADYAVPVRPTVEINGSSR